MPTQVQEPSPGASGPLVNAEQPRARHKTKKKGRHPVAPYVMAAPFAALFLVFFIAPLLYALWQSFYSEQRSGLGFGEPEVAFVGIDNYLKAFTDPQFLGGFGRVLLYAVVMVPLGLFISASLALLLDYARLRARSFFRTSIFMPYAVPGVIAVLMWGFMYNPQLSPFAALFEFFGAQPPALLEDAIFVAIGNITIWQWSGYNMIIIFAALQAIPGSLYEAAKLDGLGEFKTALRIKLPLVSPAIFLTMLFSIIGSMQLFNEPQILASLTSSISSSFTPNLYLYTVAFTGGDYHYAAALSVVMALVTFGASFWVFRKVASRAN